MPIEKRPYIKCLVWDLDNTLWDGIIMEGDDISVRPEAESLIKELDKRGIVQSIASRNHYKTAKKKLEEAGLWDYFLCPQIYYGIKSASLEIISRALDIHMSSIAFIDDSRSEREEVLFRFPEVYCIDAEAISSLANNELFNPPYVSAEAATRRLLYATKIKRDEDQKDFKGTNEEFLSLLNLTITIERARPNDFTRVYELIQRTNQFNNAPCTLSSEELRQRLNLPIYMTLITTVTDKYGSHGKTGVCIIKDAGDSVIIEWLLMSCRVLPYGVGSVFICLIKRIAVDMGKVLFCRFVTTKHNRMMLISLKLNGFSEKEKYGDELLLWSDPSVIPQIPAYYSVDIPVLR